MPEKKIVIKLKYGAVASQNHGSLSLPSQPQYDWNYKRIAWAVGVMVITLMGYRLLIGSPEPDVAKSINEINVPSESIISEKQRTITNSRPSAGGVSSIQQEEVSEPNASQSLTDSEITTTATGTTRQVIPPAKQGLSVQGRSELDVADTAAFQDAAYFDTLAPVQTKNIVRAQFTWGIKNKEPTSELRSPAILQPGDSVALYFFSEFNNMDGQILSHEWSHNGKVVVNKDFQINEDHWRVFSSKQLTSDLLGKWKVTIKDSKGENLGEFVLAVLEPNKSKI